ncbi:hypothetical protein NDU88_004344 [Pleurodeles waltl]|uniref:Uncharacterized protein n=1 Tax=Pleurodeles waltl TaxID=8319 RepID=A0AAV7RK17_PLEWA|nr:hypothetical protein NDU88_004344 [Pleurodeles waltl]
MQQWNRAQEEFSQKQTVLKHKQSKCQIKSGKEMKEAAITPVLETTTLTALEMFKLAKIYLHDYTNAQGELSSNVFHRLLMITARLGYSMRFKRFIDLYASELLTNIDVG